MIYVIVFVTTALPLGREGARQGHVLTMFMFWAGFREVSEAVAAWWAGAFPSLLKFNVLLTKYGCFVSVLIMHFVYICSV